MRVNFLFLLLCLKFVLNTYATQDKLIFSLDVIRHGDRTPVYAIPTVPFIWPEGLGQLSAEGMQQEFKLGVKARLNYITKHNLLPANYVNNTIEVQSTDSDRAIMSAQSFLMGLYPPGTGPQLAQKNEYALPHAIQVIPVHTVPRSLNSIIPAADQKTLNESLSKYVQTLPEWEQKTQFMQANFKRWSVIFGKNISKLDDLENIGDTLLVHKIHNIAFPQGLTQEEAEEIIEARQWIHITRYKVKEVSDLIGKKILYHINNYLTAASLKQKPLKYVLLSAHDATLSSIMKTLDAPLNEVPPYASNINFSLFEDSSGQFFVTVSYNDAVQFIPKCGGRETCSLDEFLKDF